MIRLNVFVRVNDSNREEAIKAEVNDSGSIHRNRHV